MTPYPTGHQDFQGYTDTPKTNFYQGGKILLFKFLLFLLKIFQKMDFYR